ncbi:MAG: hypothetical protein OXG15_03095 [Gammaproteobacteria bacterium]|nr:hypothetical protein [Gammaproteobacteria bacterium]
MKIWLIVCVFVALLAGAALAIRFWTTGDFNVAHSLLILFLTVNILVSYWEICLFLRISEIEEKRKSWDSVRSESGAVPALKFLTMSVPLRKVFAPSVWAELWGVYSLYDASYADRKTFGFNCDVANGVVTPLLSLLLLGTFTIPFLPARVAGILGVLLFWQWIYVTSAYIMSFFMAGRHRLINRKEILIYIWGPNLFWIVLPIFGFYVSVRLVLEGSYVALGLN